jgi:WD40 repeat protein
MELEGLAFSPDGSRLASSSVDGSILLWDVASHRRVFRPLAHSGEVYTGAFHPNGKMLASGSSDQTIRIWNVDTGLPLGPPSRAPEAVYGVAFSPDGRRLASACKNGTVVLWNVSESPVANPLSIIKTLNAHDGNAYSVAFSSDGKTLASAGSDNKIVLSDGDTGRPLPVSPLKGHTNEVFTVAFSPTNPNRLASGGMDTSIRLWDITTGKPIGQPLKQHSRTVFMINFSPDGAKLASVALDAKTLLWDITATNPTSRALTGYREGALSVAFSPVKGSTTLASGSVNGDVVLWDVPTRKWLGTPVESLTDWVYRVKFSPDRDTLAATTAGNQIMLWSQSTAQVIGSLKGHSKHIKSLDFSPDGKTLASASEDGSVILWDLGTHKRRGAPLSEHQGSVEAVAWSHDGKMLASGGTDSTVILRDGHTGSPLPSSPLNNGASVLTLAFSRDGHFLASGADSDIILWDISLPHPTEMRLHGHEERPAHGQLPVHQGHSRLVTSVEFSPDSKTLASGSHDRNVILWDVASRRQRMVLYGHEDAVTSIAFSPDGAILASASEDRSVILWDVATGRQLGPPLREHNAKVHSVAFSPDGKTLASGSNKESDNWALILWDVNPESWQSRACDVAARNITSDEWERYVGASARDITCPTALLWDADARALENRTPEASREFQHLVDLALKSSNPELSNEVCWFGSIHRFAEIVMPACERAVSLDPSNGAYHDSKALAHAVMGVGGRQDALKHLEIFIKWARNKPTLAPQLAKRKIWIDALNLGQNPFDDEATLRSLRFESNGREASK